ncbi:hypothetical protein MAM1_0293d09338 [Mucor ambiguus]|uniref:Zn(2)-C6 fungal-type domain-containing protein n=1 Tax=Mucor ambiguus TaxID=91626 RepID=A0A0C9LX79_9FUNG|nr:hypothetical protein MAM1_0293d09338 [Mucor ambiguus]
MDMQVPIGQLLLQQGYFDNSTIPTQVHQPLQQQSLIQDLQVPVLEQIPALNGQTLTKPKRKQVKNACVHCQKACKKCDDGRPCQRCLKYNLADTCRNSIRKERQKGLKRGPYKRKPGESDAFQHKSKKLALGQTAMIASNVISQVTNTQTTCSPMPVLPVFVTPDASPNNNKDALTTASASLSQSTNIPHTFGHHDLLMMPFSFVDNTALQQDQFPLVTTTTTSYEYNSNKQQHLLNDVPTYSTPTMSPAAASATQFRFISQNNDFAL